MFYEVIPEGKVERLTYRSDISLLTGQIVVVPVGKRQVPGVVVKKVIQPDIQCKPVSRIIYSKPLPRHLVLSTKFVHEYYLAPSGSVISLILPNGVEKKRRAGHQCPGVAGAGLGCGAFRSAAARELAREPRGDGRERRGPEWNTSATITQTSSQDTDTALLRAVDENKDQTYFLYRISDEALMHTIFPIGGMMKPDVKKLAAERGLHNAYKKESMGVCFVGEVGMKDFLKGYIDVEPGEIREAENERVLGYHEGAVFYTIGQRHGLYLSGVAGEVNDGLPYYVVAKDIKNNIVYVSKNLNHEAVWATELELRDVIMRGPAAQGQVLARLRHRGPLIPATFDGKTLKFENAIKRPATGQSAVLYDGEVCLGGGIITA